MINIYTNQEHINLKRLFALVLLLTCSVSEAGSFARYGLGIFNSADYGRAENNYFSIGYQEDMIISIFKQYEVGFWSDSGGHGRANSGFGAVSLGVETLPGTVVLRGSCGVAAITNTDAMLGGWFQFTQDLLVGVQDHNHNTIALNYKHFSSAGIYQPDVGRDFLTVQVEIPW